MRNYRSLIVSAFVLLGAAACSGTSNGYGTSDGGDVDGSADDASSEADAGGGGGPVLPPPVISDADAKKEDSSPGCQGDQTYEGPQGNCTIASTYQCETPSGFDAFRVACSCPSATCGCYTNGALTKTVAFNGCPACSSPVELAKLCGVAGY